MVLNAEKEKRIAEIWESIHVDDVVKGKVMRFTDYGAFVDIGGIDGLLHISEISWGKLKHPKEVLEIGQNIEVKVLAMNAEKGKISLGLKQNQPEPWSVINDNYEIGQIVEGKVVQIKEYGAFPDARLYTALSWDATLSGIKEQRPRWKRITAVVEGYLGEPVGQIYVQKYFPEASKKRIEDRKSVV